MEARRADLKIRIDDLSAKVEADDVLVGSAGQVEDGSIYASLSAELDQSRRHDETLEVYVASIKAQIAQFDTLVETLSSIGRVAAMTALAERMASPLTIEATAMQSQARITALLSHPAVSMSKMDR